jgi:hypothetical protein
VLVTAISGMPAGGMVTNNDMYVACFRAKGYTVQSEEEREQAVAASERAIQSQKAIDEKEAKENALFKMEEERRKIAQQRAAQRAIEDERVRKWREADTKP